MKTKNRHILFGFIFVAVLAGALFGVTPTASAATFQVDSLLDTPDETAGDSNCDDGSGNCTLRAAIEETNALDGDDQINFSVAGTGVKTFSPATPLPEITEALVIDGTTQTGAVCDQLVPGALPAESNDPHTLVVEIDGSSISNDYGLRIDGEIAAEGEVRVIGLVINGVDSGTGIEIHDQSGDDTMALYVDCSYIGTNAAGSVAVPNEVGIVRSTGDEYVVVINSLVSGNAYSAVRMLAGEAEIEGSLFGTDATGTTNVPNNSEYDDNGALDMYQINNVSIRDNIIAGNTGSGISTSSSAPTIENNYIGVSINGGSLGNQNRGIDIGGGNGGIEVNDNVIAANGRDGLVLWSNCNTSGGIYDVLVTNNKIGTNVNGEVAEGYGNGEQGIHIYEYSGSCGTISDIRIGGEDTTADQNIIAGNAENGILLHQSDNVDVRDVSILANSIHSNGLIGIDLAHDDNDDGFADADLLVNAINNFAVTNPATVANSYVNYPEITGVQSGDNALTVDYDLTANESDGSVEIVGYRLDFYVSDDKDSSGHGEGTTHLGSFIVDGSVSGGKHTFTTDEAHDGHYVTATTTVLRAQDAD